jgi:hypothetical protein
MKMNKEDRRNEVAAYSTMFLLAAVCIILIGFLIKKLLW